MKKKFTLIVFLLISIVASVRAENYPYRSDYLWVTTPDHVDWLYKTGETAQVEVQFFKYGVPQDCDVSYEIAPDMLQPYKKGTVRLRNGKAVISVGTRKNPGFTDLRLWTSLDGKKVEHHVKVGFSVDRIEAYTKMPHDFKSFWETTVAEARKTPLTYTRELADEYCTDKVDCWLVKLQIDKSHYMYGYLTMPKEQRGKMPACFCPPGAGIKTIKEPLRHKYYAEDGFIRLECEIHGIDPRLTSTKFKEIAAAFCNGDNSYFYDRFENRDAYYMRHVYAGMVRWMDFICSLPEWDGTNIAVQGGSQGGALALVTAGLLSLNPQLSSLNLLCCVNHPALTDMAAYDEEGRTGGYPHFKKTDLTPDVKQCLAYYDVINFCRIVKCPVRMTWGYNDSTCPPTTSYAAWNTLTCPKESCITPINEHWTSERMEKQHEEWIKSKVKSYK